MAGTELADPVRQLKSASSSSEQLAALKRLKTQVIGHPVRKEHLVRLGLIEGLTRVLASRSTARESQSSNAANGSGLSLNACAASPELDEVHFQAITLLGSLAQGGPSLIAPLIAASVEDLLTASLLPADRCSRIVSASLKASVNLWTAAELSVGKRGAVVLDKNKQWTSPAIARAYRGILSQTCDSPAARSQVQLVCQMIQKMIHSEDQRELFCEVGVLDSLAAHLASHYIHNQPRSSESFSSILTLLPTPPSSTTLAEILGAINTLVQPSKYRVTRLLLSPPLVPIFRFYKGQVALETRLYQPSTCVLYDIHLPVMNVPCIHYGIQKLDSNFMKAFPALGSGQLNNKTALVDLVDYERPQMSTSFDVDNGIISWLIHLMRTDKGLLRVRSARLLASIAHAEHVSRAKSNTFALLVIPLLLELMKASPFLSVSSASDSTQDPQEQAISEVPLALSELLEESSISSAMVLKAAYDAGIVKEACQYLKKTFDQFGNRAPLWSDSYEADVMDEDQSGTRTLGARGVSAGVRFLFRCREAALLLIHSIANNRPGEDKYRKALMENDVMRFIVDSLIPLNEDASAALQVHASKQKLDSSVGNPDNVLVAACRASKAMSRSVYLLRTSLIDIGVSKPAYRLVQSSSVDVQVAALAVMSNMLVDCSPMRQAILDDGALPLLCKLARSNDTQVKAGSLRALKNLVGQAPSEVKQACCEELGMNWLVSVIEGSNGLVSSSQSTSAASTHASINPASNFVGEQVSIIPSPDHDEDMEQDSPQHKQAFSSDIATGEGSAGPFETGGAEPAFSKFLDPNRQARLDSIKAAEDHDKLRRPQSECVQIEAHALDILRNVVCGPGEQAMIDYVVGNIGHFKLYDLLAAKLQPPERGAQSVDHIPVKTLDAALKTLCHIAAGPPRYRADLIGQHLLLQLLRPLFHHPEPDIRSTCCWILTNLMWVDDSSDVHNAKDRASRLKEMGFGIPLDELSRKLSDGGKEQSQDVRERASAARDCMIQATEGHGARMSDPTGLGHGVGLRAS
ncbi:MAG: hypothetical protein Q9162_003986 [Coniocarpon cinnabarinum]